MIGLGSRGQESDGISADDSVDFPEIQGIRGFPWVISPVSGMLDSYDHSVIPMSVYLVFINFFCSYQYVSLTIINCSFHSFIHSFIFTFGCMHLF